VVPLPRPVDPVYRCAGGGCQGGGQGPNANTASGSGRPGTAYAPAAPSALVRAAASG